MNISIITTTLNSEKYIDDCLNSIKKQSNFQDVQHVIVDGNSEDRTLEILKKYENNNKNVKLIVKDNINIYQGLNIGIENAENEIIGILHSDDFYLNDEVLKKVSSIFKNNPEYNAIYSNVKIVFRKNINKTLRFFKSSQLNYNDYLNCKHPAHVSFFVKKKVFNEYGLYNEDLQIASDFEWMLRVFGKFKLHSHFLNETFVVMRSGGASTKNIGNIIKSNYEVFKSFKINNLKVGFFAVFAKILRKIKQFNI